jgi:hypothetical protein
MRTDYFGVALAFCIILFATSRQVAAANFTYQLCATNGSNCVDHINCNVEINTVERIIKMDMGCGKAKLYDIIIPADSKIRDQNWENRLPKGAASSGSWFSATWSRTELVVIGNAKYIHEGTTWEFNSETRFHFNATGECQSADVEIQQAQNGKIAPLVASRNAKCAGSMFHDGGIGRNGEEAEACKNVEAEIATAEAVRKRIEGFGTAATLQIQRCELASTAFDKLENISGAHCPSRKTVLDSAMKTIGQLMCTQEEYNRYQDQIRNPTKYQDNTLGVRG